MKRKIFFPLHFFFFGDFISNFLVFKRLKKKNEISLVTVKKEE